MATTSATSSSGLDVASIVSQLMTVEQRPLNSLATKEAGIQARISAYGNVSSALSNFQSALLSGLSASTFQGLTASSSNNTALSASASSAATAGTYAVNVTTLAQAQQLAAQGQASQTAPIGLGGTSTLTFDFGTIAGAPPVGGKYTGASFTSNGNGLKTVSIDATNNSLQGIRDAINAANIGVTASIVNDGSANPYRLTLSSSAQGVSNSIKISVAPGVGGDTGLSNLLAHDPANNTGQSLTETAVAQNANFTVNGVAVSKTSNSVSDAISGVTLNLLQTTTAPVSLSVAHNTSAIPTAIAGFVKAYNDLHATLAGVSSYNAATKKGAILQGDYAVRTITSQLHGVLNTPVSGAGALTTLSQIGITFQKDGSMALDSAKLSTAISNNLSDIASLFTSVGKASDSLVSFSSAASTVKAGSYAVNVTALATQGNTTGTVNLNGGSPATDILPGTTFNVTLDGVATSVALTAGTAYTAAGLATMIQSAINGTPAFSLAGSSVSATIDGSGNLVLTSNRYGTASNISLSAGAGGTLPSALVGAAPANTPGVNVAGTIDGVAATGSGQSLTSTSGNATGLKIQINGGALGARGAINYSQGYASLLTQLSTALLATDGLLDGKTTGLNKTIADIGKQRDALNVRLAAIQKTYTKQFSALDVMLSSMNSTSTYLTQQLANLPKP